MVKLNVLENTSRECGPDTESRSYNDLIAYRRAQNKAVKEYRKAKKKFEKKLAKNI